MVVKIESQAPHTRCYICGRPEVDKVCHHCGRAICSSDKPAPLPSGGNVENPEFDELDLATTPAGESGIHCQDHVHFHRSNKRMITWGIALGILGVLGFVLGLAIEDGATVAAIGFLAAAAGIVLAIAGYRWQRNRYQQDVIDSRPPLPVLGSIESLAVSETILGQVSFDTEGQYSARAGLPQGKLTLAYQFAPDDRARLDKYLTKYGLTRKEEVFFHAGFAVLEGAADLRFDDSRALMPGQVNTLALTDQVSEQPYLMNAGQERMNRWTIRQTYSFQPCGQEALRLPIQIFPSLVQEGGQQVIELIVQMTPNLEGLSLSPSSARVEELSLRVPQSLGRVETVDPSAVTSREGALPEEGEEAEHTLLITWKGVRMGTDRSAPQSARFYVRFEQKVEPTMVFSGRLRMRFDGTASGLDGVALFYPLGNKRTSPTLQTYTYIDVEYHLDLGGLRFQEMASAEEELGREGVVPDYRVVTALTNAISADEFYVKRVIENPARPTKTDANILNRYWDIAGRYYDGVYPMDYHVVLTGEEVFGQAARTRRGKTQANITVQGMVTGDEMRAKVEGLRDRLATVIHEVLEEQPEAPLEPELPEELPASLPEPIPAVAPVTPVAPVAPLPVEDRATQLQGRLDKLDDALLDGTITEARYEDMRQRILDELANLGAS